MLFSLGTLLYAAVGARQIVGSPAGRCRQVQPSGPNGSITLVMMNSVQRKDSGATYV